MTIEEVEQASIAYLNQTSNPLVRVGVLHTHVTSRSKDDSLTIHEFTEFLNQHSDIRILDPLSTAQDEETAKQFETAGFTTVPCAILTSRVPSPKNLAATMLEQLESMTDALSRALEEARETGDSTRGDQIYKTLERISAMKQKVIGFTKTS